MNQQNQIFRKTASFNSICILATLTTPKLSPYKNRPDFYICTS